VRAWAQLSWFAASTQASERHLSLKAEQGSDANAFAIDQKSQVTSCYFQNCRTACPKQLGLVPGNQEIRE